MSDFVPLKKGTKLEVRDSDGGTTRAAIVEDTGAATVTVKWLEARWNLTANVLVARKGTTSRVLRSLLVP